MSTNSILTVDAEPYPFWFGDRTRKGKARRQLSGLNSCSYNRLDECGRLGNRAENTALHFNHLEGSQVVVVIGCAGAVGEHQALEAAVIRLAKSGVNANVGGN